MAIVGYLLYGNLCLYGTGHCVVICYMSLCMLYVSACNTYMPVLL